MSCRNGRFERIQAWHSRHLQSHFSGSQELPNSNFQAFLPYALSILLFSGSLEGLCATSAGHLGEVLAVSGELQQTPCN